MGMLITLQGPDAGRKYPLEGNATVLGRQADCTICLPNKAVSRQHAQIVREGDAYFLEDLGSSNGTLLNGARLNPRVRAPLAEQDTFQIGPYLFGLRPPSPAPEDSEPSLVIREQLSVAQLNESVY